ncbi:MAG: hypothetical protein M3384_14345 [Acidobacteriota bacterium]|nr:hypothetical protein [Acidobacteriota bacterium]
MSFIEKAERELAKGNLWRAKEILQGSLPSAGYNIELFEKFGIVLLQMGDLPEAGKFLFLSGVRKPEYEEAICIFLQKYGKKPLNFFQTLPHTAKLSKISDYPEIVAAKLRELNFPETLKTENGDVDVLPEDDDKILLAGCIIIALAIAALVILGIIKLYEIVF